MAFFGLGVVVWLALAPGMRKWFATPWPWVAAALALAIFSPMLIWNAGHDWASFVYLFNRRLVAHGWAPHRVGEFIGTQLGMMTPPVFILACIGIFRMARGEGGPASARILIHAMIWPPMLYFLWHSLHQRVEANWLEPDFIAFAAAAAVAAHSVPPRQPWRAITEISRKCAAPLGLFVMLVLYLQATVGIVTRANDPIAGPFGAGWKDFAIVLDDTRKRLGADVVLTDEYALAGWMGFYLPSHPPMFQIIQRNRYLNDPKPDPAEFNGVMLYVCGEENNPYAADRLRRFASVEFVGAEPRTRNGVVIENYMIYRVSKPIAPVLDAP
jgi:hypothetical protein